MKILYDHQIFAIQEYGGVSRYFLELIIHLKKLAGLDCILPLKFSNNFFIRNSNLVKTEAFLPRWCFPGKSFLTHTINIPNMLSHFKKGDYDLFHPTYYSPYFLKALDRKPFVLTIYDMIHERYSSFFSRTDSMVANKKLLAQKATKIIAISESTKKDIIDFYKFNPQKIEVIHLATSLRPHNDLTGQKKLPQRYILFVGLRHLYKNFEMFLKAIGPIFKEDQILHLICAGGGGFSKKENALMDELGIKDKVISFMKAADTDLAHLYQNAAVFVFPSLYEGFGIPVLEAFACGCPTALSDSSSLPEVGGSAAIYFNPHDPVSIRNAVEKIIYDEALRSQLRLKGYEQLKKFSWEATACKTRDLYWGIL